MTKQKEITQISNRNRCKIYKKKKKIQKKKNTTKQKILLNKKIF